MIRCAACGGNHRSARTAERCAEDARKYGLRDDQRKAKYQTRVDKSYDSWLAAAPEREARKEEDRLRDTEVPNGRYFIPREKWSPNGLKVWVRKFDEGRWKGVWFITDLNDKPSLVDGSVADRQYLIEILVRSGPHGCMCQYGRVTGRCGVCNEELTEDEREKYAGHLDCFREVWEQPVLSNA